VISSLILIAIIVGGLMWKRSARGLGDDTSEEAQAIRETILRARRIRIEAEYTFDTSKFDTVYINDPRGGEMPAEALAQIREIRQDPTIRMDQVGFLDSMQIDIENLKREYDNYMTELRTKQADGTLTDDEQLILEGETYGWLTPEPEAENAAAIATQACELLQAEAMAYWETETALPGPETVTPVSGTAYPGPEGAYTEPEAFPCPTSTPTPLPIDVPYRGSDPTTLSQEEFNIDIYSIEIEGDIAKAVVHKRAVTSEYVLVKGDGQWYIAGAKLLKFEP
jgi:hypothetical protein